MGLFSMIKGLFSKTYKCPDCGANLKLRECGYQCTSCRLIVSSIDPKTKKGVVGDGRIYESTELKVGKGWLTKEDEKL